MASRQDQRRVTASLDGVYLGAWESRTGGDTDSNSVTWFQAAMGDQISLGGNRMVANVIVACLVTTEIKNRQKWIRSRVGKGFVTVVDQPVDDEGFPDGDADTWTGRLKRAKIGDSNRNTNAAQEFEMEIESPVYA